MSLAGRLGGQMNRMRAGGYGTASALPMSGSLAPEGVSGGLGAMLQRPMPTPDLQPAMLPRVQAPGFKGFAERFFTPDPSTPGGALTLAARYAGAAFGDPVSSGMLQMERDQEAERRRAQQDEVTAFNLEKARAEMVRPDYMRVGNQIVAVAPEGGVSVAYEAPPEPPTSGPLAYLGAMGIDPQSPEGRAMLTRAMTGFQYSPEAQQARISTAGAVADAQGAARARYRAPERAPGGAAATKTIGGRTFVKVGDQWFER